MTETFTSKERGKEAKRAKDTANQQTQGQGKAPILEQKGYHPLDVTYKHYPFVHATVLVIRVTCKRIQVVLLLGITDAY